MTNILKIRDQVLGFFGNPLPTDEEALAMCGYTIGDEEELIDENGEYTGMYLEEVEYRPATDEELADDEEAAEEPEYYYWLDTTETWNPEPTGEVIMIRGKYDEDGEKDRDTEEEILKFNVYTDAGVDKVREKEYGEVQWEPVDAYIEKELGFLPDYEVN